ncbi:dihydrofolate reductase family protein [Actinacidiphila alni]|uniref:dihydrofolate reductase family protein n=1 Tax=Actinacidiphila alni TaxID=380248 RepID=UPI00345149CC
MRKVIMSMSVSLDGFMEGPDREIDWHRVDAELHQHFNDELAGAGAFINGRVTHELMAGFWPTADEDPEADPRMAEFAGIWRGMPKIVYSRTLDPAAHTAWHTTVKREIDPDEIRALLAEPGGDLVVGGAEVSGAFRDLGLIDEYRIYVHPVLIGRGTPCFATADAMDVNALTLVESRTFGNGVVLLRYSTR